MGYTPRQIAAALIVAALVAALTAWRYFHGIG
jgi:hypothetical protein